MSQPDFNHHDDALDAYLDGLLDDAQKQAFEARLRSDPELRAQLDRQVQVDRSLRRQVALPDVSAVVAAALSRAGRIQPMRHPRTSPPDRRAPGRGPRPRPRTQPRLPRMRWLRPVAEFATQPLTWKSGGMVAAVLLLTVGLVAYAPGWFKHRPRYGPPYPDPRDPTHQPALDSTYDVIVAQGFRPTWPCQSTNDFPQFVSRVMGEGLALESPPPDVQITGLDLPACGHRFPNMALMARVQGMPVVVFIDRVAAKQRPSLTPGAKLHVYEKQIGNLLVREVSPLAEAHVRDLLEPVPGPGPETRPQ